jgi:rifampicin phosphotransferase
VRSLVLSLDEVGAGDAGLVGGKGANLGELLRSGFPVPPGFVVCADAYARILEALDLGAELRQLLSVPPEESVQRCAIIRERLENEELSRELADLILAAHGRLIENRGRPIVCAVRSSATAEDLGAASFAGQHGTYYYVDAAQLLKKIRQCWGSLWSPEAVSYRATHGIDHASVSMAVVVQEMIASEVSGVSFTANPVSGSRDEVIIESSWGMGAAIVDGRVTPDNYVLERAGLRVRSQRIADKRLMVAARLEAGQKARLDEVPNAMRRRESLTPDLLRTVAEWSLKCESHFGKPQDVEWAICEGRFYLLQSRPITVLGREDIGRDIKGKYVLFKPLVENFTDPFTPLAGNLLMLIPSLLFRSIHGWIYVDVEAVRRPLPFKVSAEALADYLYSISKDAPAWKVSVFKLPALLVLGFMFFIVNVVLLLRTRNLPDGALDSYRALCEKVGADPLIGPADAMVRLLLLPKLRDPVANMPLLLNLLAVRYISRIRVLRRLVRRWAPDVRADAEAILCSGSEGVLSAEMGRGIWALAVAANRNARVRGILLAQAPERALAELKSTTEAQDFLRSLDGFLAKNGHRAIKEWELRSPRWEENPAVVLGMVRNYLLIEAAPSIHEQKAADARAELIRDLRARLQTLPLERAFGLRLRLILFAAERVRYFQKMRENSRFYYIMGIGVVRKIVLRIERELMRQGRLKCKDDIFFLRVNELTKLQAGRLGWLDVEDRIRERRIEHIRLCKMGPPKVIGIEMPEKYAPATQHEGATLLQGQPASPGAYEGRARVILDPSIDVELAPGEVLVAPYTDPAWTPLFLTAGAAVVEVGSYLSHAGTVAREFGMPCVVDVAEATQKIRSGDRVAVDGNLGSVRILPRQADP